VRHKGVRSDASIPAVMIEAPESGVEGSVGPAPSMEVHTSRAAIIAMVNASSSALALLLEICVAAQFGATRAMDAYLTAAVIPNLVIGIFPATLAVIFVPIFLSYVHRQGAQQAWRSAASLLLLVGALSLAIGIALLLFAPWIVGAMAPGFSAESTRLAGNLLRVMSLGMVFTGCNSVLVALHQSQEQFTRAALMPALQNIVLIVFVVALAGSLGIFAMSWGMLTASVIQFALLIRLMRGRTPFRLANPLKEPGVQEALRLSVMVMLSGLAYYSFGISDRFFGSSFTPGSIAHMGYAARIGNSFASLAGVAVGTLSLTAFSAALARGNVGEFVRTLRHAICVLAVALVPALAAMLAVRVPLISILLARRNFGPEDVEATADILLCYTGFILAFWVGRPLALAFLAGRAARSLLIVNTASLAAYVLLSYVLGVVCQLQARGLALASSLVHLVNIAVLGWLLTRRYRQIEWKGVIGYVGKTVLMGAGVFVLVQVLHGAGSVTRGQAVAMAAVVWAGGMLVLYVGRDRYVRRIADVLLDRLSTLFWSAR